jgi:hypothetical protein
MNTSDKVASVPDEIQTEHVIMYQLGHCGDKSMYDLFIVLYTQLPKKQSMVPILGTVQQTN